MPKPLLWVSTGDEHAGSDTGVAVPKFNMESKGRDYPISERQLWLLDRFKDFVEKVKVEAKGRKVIYGHGGDGTDGPLHHGTTTTYGNRFEQIGMLYEFLRPLLNIADEFFVLEGTPAHVGEEGDEDRSLGRMMGAKQAGYWILELDGKILNWAHKGITVSMNPYSETRGMERIAEMEYWLAMRQGRRKADFILRHHAHHAPDPIERRGIKVAVAPCWQMRGNYGNHKLVQPDIGGLIWKPDTMEVKVVKYAEAETPTIISAGDRVGSGFIFTGNVSAEPKKRSPKKAKRRRYYK